MRVPITRVDPSLPLPAYATDGSVGFDFTTRVTTRVAPGGMARIPSNLIVATPPGYMLLVAVRSSTPHRTGLRLSNAIGIVDQDFAGPDDEIHIDVWNPTNRSVVVERGERIAQGVFVSVAVATWDERETPDAPSRGGFGSTG
ncbi:MAG: dUTP diphosphatase [Chloroflexota bacterium]|nr:dUTP diphosphatase [Chloroflexota bacterium]MDE2897033.1 dUTP diphosphatase [Chloroflexota bacterium]